LNDDNVNDAGGLSWVQLALVQAYTSIRLVLVLGMLWFMDTNGMYFCKISCLTGYLISKIVIHYLLMSVILIF